MKTIITLAELNRNDLPLAGGKGANLGALIQAGMPVPGGFCCTTAAYRRFVEENRLQERILAHLEMLHPDNPAELESASADIRALFDPARLPADMVAEITAAYHRLAAEIGAPAPAVAVRSSATAEDLPDLSFAGQQDTYLNIVGEEALVQAVVRCWASLWTARAIGYRSRNRIAHAEVALAVVVQLMVPSEASGVLFSANPLSGKRPEVVIDATLGLGEALVSGQVEPDHYAVDTQTNRITQKSLGQKALVIRPLAGGGTETLSNQGAATQAISDAQILELSRFGKQAEAFFGSPQDMEWGLADDKLFVLQSRPITSLFPLPENLPVDPLRVLLSFGVWQVMLDPISPLGRDVFAHLATGMGHVFGSQIDVHNQSFFYTAGERVFVNFTELFHTPLGRTLLRIIGAAIDPTIISVIEALFMDERLKVDSKGNTPGSFFQILRLFQPLGRRVVGNLFQPIKGRQVIQTRIDALLADTRNACEQAQGLTAIANLLENTALASPQILLYTLVAAVASGQAPYQILLRLTSSIPESGEWVMDLNRGLEYNVTTDMDLNLWEVSRTIASDPLSKSHFLASDISELKGQTLSGSLPPAAQDALNCFLQIYGARGVGEVDIYRPRWQDDPTHILQVLKGYLQVNEESASPKVLHQRGALKAAQSRQKLVEAVRCTPLGFVKAPLVNFLAGRVRELAGLRETPKFAIVRLLTIVRSALMKEGQNLVDAGTLTQADDVFFLHSWELKQLDAGLLPNPQALVAQRRLAYTQEMGRRRLPHLLLSDGTAYYEGLDSSGEDNENVLCGNPVSAGVVEGIVRVILDPNQTQLLPGEILVCPATDPAWTPLFLTAAGLVMEVGGMMTHGSVVAREYGLPAVVGVSQATTRLQTGQRVRVDGSNGKVTLL